MTAPDPVCVYCGRRGIDPAWRPFCSERCKLADLGRWFSEDYRIPGTAEAADDIDEEDVE